MSARDGDGWVACRCGGKHWGLHGAAGLLLVRNRTLLLQHRSEWVHNGDTWGIPGGARDSHESPVQAAIREAVEETGIDPQYLTVHLTHTDDHSDWRYDTIIASAHPELIPHQMNAESQELRWMDWDQIDVMKLHPSFAKSWPAVNKLLIQLF
jgi:8-oxo-dGTP diphosphatase